MTSEDLFKEARALFPDAANVYASVSVQTARATGEPFTSYSIGIGSDNFKDSGFDIAYAHYTDSAGCLKQLVESAEVKKQK